MFTDREVLADVFVDKSAVTDELSSAAMVNPWRSLHAVDNPASLQESSLDGRGVRIGVPEAMGLLVGRSPFSPLCSPAIRTRDRYLGDSASDLPVYWPEFGLELGSITGEADDPSGPTSLVSRK
jgi:hypothetical protein